MSPDHYRPDLVICGGALSGKDVNVYRPDGSLLLAFRRRAVPAEVCRIAYPGIRRAARWSEHRQAESGILGFYDYEDGVRPGATAFTRNSPGDYRRSLPFLRALDGVFRREVPDKYAHQLLAVAGTDRRWVIQDTVFTTATVNRSMEFKAHRDKNNLPRSFAAIGVFRAGWYGGGYLVFPRWGVAADLRTRDVLLADVSELHGVTPFEEDEGRLEFERISVVAYIRAGLAKRPSPPPTPFVCRMEEQYGCVV
jgi:hypothetical protein